MKKIYFNRRKIFSEIRKISGMALAIIAVLTIGLGVILKSMDIAVELLLEEAAAAGIWFLFLFTLEQALNTENAADERRLMKWFAICVGGIVVGCPAVLLHMPLLAGIGSLAFLGGGAAMIFLVVRDIAADMLGFNRR